MILFLSTHREIDLILQDTARFAIVYNRTIAHARFHLIVLAEQILSVHYGSITL